MVDHLAILGAALTYEERAHLAGLASYVQTEFGVDALIVNIGVMWGASMHCLRTGAPDVNLIGIDIDYTDHPIVQEEELNAEFILGDSTELCNTFGRVAHAVFVDGSHRYEDVLADAIGWGSKVVHGGLIIFHDYAPADIDLKRDPSLADVKRAVECWFLDNSANWELYATVDSTVAYRRI